MHRLLFLLVVALVSIATARPASAAAARPPAPCSASGAASPSIAEVQKRFELWVGRCVRLRGIVAGRRLYADRAALTEPLRPDESAPAGSIVIYPKPGLSPPARAAPVELVGRIGSCADAHAAVAQMQAEHPDDILMVSGYCHTSVETYVEPGSIRRLGGGVKRLVEAEVPAARRSLVEAPEAAPGAQAHLAAVGGFVAAVVSGDEQAFRRLVAPESQDELDKLHGAPAPEWLSRDLAENRKLFRAARNQRADLAAIRQWKLFLARDELAAWRRSGDRPVAFIACGCRSASCAGLWPVTPLDADSDPSRPYRCIRSHDYLIYKGRTVIQILAETPAFGFEEPLWEKSGEGHASRTPA
jgi:hypothetical protein